MVSGGYPAAVRCCQPATAYRSCSWGEWPIRGLVLDDGGGPIRFAPDRVDLADDGDRNLFGLSWCSRHRAFVDDEGESGLQVGATVGEWPVVLVVDGEVVVNTEPHGGDLVWWDVGEELVDDWIGIVLEEDRRQDVVDMQADAGSDVLGVGGVGRDGVEVLPCGAAFAAGQCRQCGLGHNYQPRPGPGHTVGGRRVGAAVRGSRATHVAGSPRVDISLARPQLGDATGGGEETR